MLKVPTRFAVNSITVFGVVTAWLMLYSSIVIPWLCTWLLLAVIFTLSSLLTVIVAPLTPSPLKMYPLVWSRTAIICLSCGVRVVRVEAGVTVIVIVFVTAGDRGEWSGLCSSALIV